MKSTTLFLFLSMAILFTTSCAKDDAVDFDMLRSNIVGTWNVTISTQVIRVDTVYDEFSSTTEILFSQDGTGLKESPFGDNIPFKWIYQFNPEQVFVAAEQAGIALENTQLYDVLINESNRQVWYYEIKDQSGINDVYQHTWKMDKQ